MVDPSVMPHFTTCFCNLNRGDVLWEKRVAVAEPHIAPPSKLPVAYLVIWFPAIGERSDVLARAALVIQRGVALPHVVGVGNA